jgi:hypothetical protein
MVLGHLAIAGIVRRTFWQENFLFLFVASYGPDLIDKSLYFIFGYPSKGLGHSLLMFFLITTLAWFLRKRVNLNKTLLQIGVVLWASHLVADILYLQILFWPLLGPPPFEPSYSILERLWHYYILHDNVLQLSGEIFLILILLILWLPIILSEVGIALSASKPETKVGRTPR